MSSNASAVTNNISPYADPVNPALPVPDMQLDLSRTALVVIDPQIDFLSPQGVTWGIFGESIVEHDTVKHIGQLFAAAKQAGIVVAVSPHYYYPVDHDWDFGGPLEQVMHKVGMFDRKGPLTLDGFHGSGADFMPEFKPYILDGKTIIASPHKVYGPETNDLTLQLRKKGVTQIVLAGMAANLCVESHLREFIEQGFEVAVVRDATAGPKLPDGDGYLAALVNYRFLAHALWTTEKAVASLIKT
ncbi:cysteine hydrolase family protein [Herbaspirillum rhizosphaerae]|uniref:cysteine hydrolase family protein n=1 Tax=Herbaspirillum rhizosphaerae TaxID=346179 RepID=UPI00067E39AF|nr:cysteine hydrolase [Herbaspirillum rhizosphaerae]